MIYSYLLLKAIKMKNPVIGYDDISEVIARVNLTKTSVKRYLLVLRAHDPSVHRIPFD